MSSWADITRLIASSDPLVAQEAAKAKALREQYEAGIITESEYQELKGDIANLNKIDRTALSVERHILLSQGFDLILKFLL